MTAILELFKNDTFHFWYVMGGLVIMALPMIILSRWYHANINMTAGGRALMERQNATGAYAKDLAKGWDMARDISDGRYGPAARNLQNRVYFFTAIWIVALVLYFGLLLWADSVNKAVPPT